MIQIEKIIDIRRYSTKIRLLRVTARVICFWQVIKRKCRITSFDLSAIEIEEAERIWIRRIQSSEFQEEICCIRSGCSNAKVNQLGMFVDDVRLLRCEGRIRKASVLEIAKQPIFHSHRHPFSELVIATATKLSFTMGLAQP